MKLTVTANCSLKFIKLEDLLVEIKKTIYCAPTDLTSVFYYIFLWKVS